MKGTKVTKYTQKRGKTKEDRETYKKAKSKMKIPKSYGKPVIGILSLYISASNF